MRTIDSLGKGETEESVLEFMTADLMRHVHCARGEFYAEKIRKSFSFFLFKVSKQLGIFSQKSQKYNSFSGQIKARKNLKIRQKAYEYYI